MLLLIIMLRPRRLASPCHLVASPCRLKQTPFDPLLKRLSQHCKQLVVGLKLWREGRLDEGQVSEMYTALVGDFQLLVGGVARHASDDAVNARACALVEAAEFHALPERLRTALEILLATTDRSVVVDDCDAEVKQVIVEMLQQLNQLKMVYVNGNTNAIVSGNGGNGNAKDGVVVKDVADVDVAATSAVSCESTVAAVPEETATVDVPAIATTAVATPSANTATTVTLYLQLQNETKRVVIPTTPPITHSSLCLLFMHTFQQFHCHPESDDFPPIYVHDMRNGVFYELAEADVGTVVGEGTVLKLWTEGESKRVWCGVRCTCACLLHSAATHCVDHFLSRPDRLASAPFGHGTDRYRQTIVRDQDGGGGTQ